MAREVAVKGPTRPPLISPLLLERRPAHKLLLVQVVPAHRLPRALRVLVHPPARSIATQTVPHVLLHWGHWPPLQYRKDQQSIFSLEP